jgi:hypothetical protein
MSITGVSPGTLNGDRTASPDGVDDFGLADGPETLPANKKFGVAMVVAGTDKRDTTNFIGTNDGNEFFNINDTDFTDSSNGEPFVSLSDTTGSQLFAESTVDVMDSTAHLVVINKLANSGGGAVEMFIDDMSADTAAIVRDKGFTHTDYSLSLDMAFFAVNDSGTTLNHKAFSMPFIEFNTEPYSQQDRLDLKQRAPGL